MIIKTNKSELLLAWILLPFVISMSPFLLKIGPVYSFSYLLKGFNLFILGIMFLHLKLRLGVFDFILFTYFGIWGISCFINGQSLFSWGVEVANILSFLLILKFSLHKGVVSLIKVLAVMYSCLFVANLAGLILYPEGLWITVSSAFITARHNFLGLDNQITPMMITALIVFYLFGKYVNKKAGIALILLIYANCFFIFSATAVFSMVMLIVIFSVYYLNPKITNIKLIFVVALILMPLVSFYSINILSDWMYEALGKEATYSGRVYIWKTAGEMFWVKPFLGYGQNTLDGIVIGQHAHSFYINVLLQSGLAGFIIFVGLVGYTCVKFSRHIRKQIISRRDSAFFTACLGAFLIAFLMDVYPLQYLIITLFIVYYSDIFARPNIS